MPFEISFIKFEDACVSSTYSYVLMIIDANETQSGRPTP